MPTREDPMHPCRFGDGEAIALFSLPRGCVAFPEDREQALCLHHAVRSKPLGGMILVEDCSQGGEFAQWWEART